MSFQSDIASMNDAFGVLNQQASSTSESWNDPVQRRFYEQFVNTMPCEVGAFLAALVRLDSSFLSAEKKICELET